MEAGVNERRRVDRVMRIGCGVVAVALGMGAVCPQWFFTEPLSMLQIVDFLKAWPPASPVEIAYITHFIYPLPGCVMAAIVAWSHRRFVQLTVLAGMTMLHNGGFVVAMAHFLMTSSGGYLFLDPITQFVYGGVVMFSMKTSLCLAFLSGAVGAGGLAMGLRARVWRWLAGAGGSVTVLATMCLLTDTDRSFDVMVMIRYTVVAAGCLSFASSIGARLPRGTAAVGYALAGAGWALRELSSGSWYHVGLFCLTVAWAGTAWLLMFGAVHSATSRLKEAQP